MGLVRGDLHKVRIESIACGYNHSLALTPNGLLFSWGFNFFGELGIGSNTGTEKPTQVENLQ